MTDNVNYYCLTYERVSTDDQKNTPSCDDQKTTNDRYIASQDWQVAENGDYRDEGLKGSYPPEDRPGLQDLIIRCSEDKSIKAIVVTETDRLARGNLAFIPIRETLKKFEIKVIAVTQLMVDSSDEGEMMGEILAAINGFFSKITRRKSMRALDEKAKRGWYPSWAPLGFLNTNVGTEEKPNRIITVDEDRATYVRQMPKLYNQGFSYQEISDKLHDGGLIGKNGGKVSPEEIRKIIFSDFYLGEFWWRGKKYKGNHSPLFSYLEVQKARNRSQEKGHIHSASDLKDKFIFKRLPFYCGFCKTLRVTAECKVKHYKKRDAEYIFYHCTKSHGGWKKCQEPSINRDDLVLEFAEKVVKPINIGEELAEFLFEEMNTDYLQSKEKQKELLDSMNRRLGQIETEVTNLFEMRIAGKILSIGDKTPEQVYEQYKTKKEMEQQKLLTAIKKLENGSQEWQEKASNFFLDCTNATNKFLKAKEEKQHQFLRAVSSNLFLKDKQLIVTHKTPFSYLLNWPSHPKMLPG